MSVSRSPKTPKKGGPTKELSNELEVLRVQRKDAIRDCDFAKVRALDCHIDRLKEEIGHLEKGSNMIQRDLAFDLKKEEMRLRASEELQSLQTALFGIRASYQKRLGDLEESHKKEIDELGARYSEALELAAIRSVPESELLTRQAQFSAKMRDYSTAEALLDQSQQTRADSTTGRQDEVHQLFDRRRERIERRQAAEEQGVLEKLEREIEIREKKFELTMVHVKNSLAKTAADLKIRLTDEDYEFLQDFTLHKETSETPKKATPARDGSPVASEAGSKKRSPYTPRSMAKSPKSATKTPTRSHGKTPL